MIRSLSAFLAIFYLSIGALSAQQSSELGLQLRQIAQNTTKHQQMVSLFVEGDTSSIKKAVQEAQGSLKYSYGNVSAVSIPASELMEFSKDPAINDLENAERRLHYFAEQAINNNNVLPIHQGASPLQRQYKGDGVIVGIIDAGIDFSHPDFKDANGNTRIQYLWDQTKSTSNSPLPYDYGKEWSHQDIDNGQISHQEPANEFGHGTNVTGLAAGNGRAIGRHKGMAPKASLIVVALDDNRSFISSFIDAADYIFKKADAMGKPCVVNASVGTFFGSRDGKDMGARMIDKMLEQRNGRALVAAAGNAGNINYHLSYEVEKDSAFTWFSANNNNNKVAIQLWADTADFNNVKFAIGADDTSTGFQSLGRTDYLSIKQDYNLQQDGDETFKTFNLNHQGNFIGEIQTFAELNDGVYFWEAFISPSNTSFLWRFQTKGDGTFDIWSHPGLISGSSRIVEQTPPPSLVPGIDRYRFPDNEKSIVSSFTCSEKVITVGNYYNRKYYIDFNNDTVFLNNQTKGEIAKNSSKGPTRDDRTKPDISATGTTSITTGNLQNINALLNSGQAFKVAPGGMHSRNGGTSMAAPIVSGFAALYFQKNPNASFRQVRDAITLSAKTDSFTSSNVPNITWGHGKLNAFAAMNETIIYGCTDSTAFNFDPNATVDDGSCEPVIKGCMDSTALNYNPNANVSNDSCVSDTTTNITPTSGKRLHLSVYPNPLTKRTVFDYELIEKRSGKGRIIITDVLGEQVEQLSVRHSKGKKAFGAEELSKGIYFYRFKWNDELLDTGKLVVQ